MFLKFTIFASFVLHAAISAPVNSQISCQYKQMLTGSYICFLTINNPDGFDNFQRIDGNHAPGFRNTDVSVVLFSSQSYTTNFPYIICKLFRNALEIHTAHGTGNGIKELGINSFRRCERLERLHLGNNKISRIAEHSFFANPRLELLDLHQNSITELPQNIFTPLRLLSSLILSENGIKIVHADWFGSNSALSNINLRQNKIHAVDRRILDVALNLHSFEMEQNICANGTFLSPFDDLDQCFQNYVNLDVEATAKVDSRVQALEKIVEINGSDEEMILEDEFMEMKQENKELKGLVAQILKNLSLNGIDVSGLNVR